MLRLTQQQDAETFPRSLLDGWREFNGDSEDAGDAFFEDDDAILDAGGAGFFVEQFEGLVNRFVGQAKRAVVHGYHPTRIEIEKGLHSVGGIGMHVAKLRRIVGSNGKEGKLWREALPNFAETIEVGGVPGVIDRLFTGAEDVATVAAM